MSDRQQHIIQRTTIGVQSPDQRGAFELQKALGSWFWQEAQPAMEKLFAELVPEDEVISMDRLVIDLGRIRAEAVEKDLMKVFLAALRETLEDQLSGGRTQEGEGVIRQSLTERIFDHWLHFLEKGYWPTTAAVSREDETFWPQIYSHLSGEMRAVRQFRNVLGRSVAAQERLVRSYQPTQLSQLLTAFYGQSFQELSPIWRSLEQWLRQLPSSQSSLLYPALIRAVQTSGWSTIFWRFTWQTLLKSPQQLTWPELLSRLLQRIWTNPDQGLKVVLEAHKTKQWPPKLEPVLALLQERIAGSAQTRQASKIEEGEQLTESKSASPKEGEQPTSKTQEERPSQKKGKGDIPQEAKTSPEDEVPATKPADLSPTSEPLEEEQRSTMEGSKSIDPSLTEDSPAEQSEVINEEAVDSSPQPPAEAELQDLLPPNLTQPSSEEPPAFEVRKGDSFYVAAAGVVLVHPYLEPLFKELGYWKDGAYVDDQAWQRAVYLAHYLATGRDEPREEELILPKLLCGRPFQLPIAQAIPLSEEEKGEADQVLRAVIQHWQAIGKASPEGLREGFFQREAKIEKKGLSWQITIERKAQDLLLGKLPWGLSLIKLPWLEEMIHVTW